MNIMGIIKIFARVNTKNVNQGLYPSAIAKGIPPLSSEMGRIDNNIAYRKLAIRIKIN